MSAAVARSLLYIARDESAAPIPSRPALQLVRRAEAPNKGLVCRWVMNPTENRLVQIWEKQG